MFITSAQVKLWKFSNRSHLFGFGNVRAFAFQQHGNLFPTRRVFSLGNPPLLAPLIPVQKTTLKKLKTTHPPQKKEL